MYGTVGQLYRFQLHCTGFEETTWEMKQVIHVNMRNQNPILWKYRIHHHFQYSNSRAWSVTTVSNLEGKSCNSKRNVLFNLLDKQYQLGRLEDIKFFGNLLALCTYTKFLASFLSFKIVDCQSSQLDYLWKCIVFQVPAIWKEDKATLIRRCFLSYF